MPYDSNGVFSLTPGYLAVAGQTIQPSQHNPPLEDIVAQGLSAVLVRDGRSPMIGNLKMNTFRITGMGDGTAPADAVTKGQMETAVTGATDSVAYNALKFSTKSATYTAVKADNATAFRFTAAATLNLTAAATLGTNWWCEIQATNGNVTIDPNASETIDGLSTAIIENGQIARISCNGTAFATEIVGNPFVGPQLQGFSYGLGLSTNATDAANDVDVATGAAASDTSPFYLMQLGAALTKRLDANWAFGNNQGGLDTGSVSAAATYYIWLIQRSDTLAVDALFSLSSTAPTMPTSYDRKRLIGAVARSSSINSPPSSKLLAGPQYLGSVTLNAAAVDVLGIPAGAKRIMLVIEDVATAASALPIVQFITSSGAVSSGYDVFISIVSTGGTAASASTSGFPLNYASLSASYKGVLELIRNAPATNRWSSRGQVKFGSSGGYLEGDVSLGSEVTGLRITTTAGTATLSGAIKIYAEA